MNSKINTKNQRKKLAKKDTEFANARPARISPEVEKAASIARYYTFQKLPEIEVTKEDITSVKKFGESHLKSLHPFKAKGDRFGGFMEEKVTLLRNFCEKRFVEFSQPVMGFYEAPLLGNPHMKKSLDEETFNLEIIGSNKSIAEATVIETAFLILRERYPNEEFCLEINSVGDKDSMAKFGRELMNFCKKEAGNIGKDCLQAVKKDVYAFFNCSHDSCVALQEKAPKPMSYLSEASRSHFMEVLEYLESLNIPYEVKHGLIGSRSYCTETIFEIKGCKENLGAIYAIGERYNSLAKKMWGKRDIPAVGIALLIHPHFVKNNKSIKKEKIKAPKFFFVQFGFDAKLKSLKLIEMLRLAKIPVEQSLSKDKLSAQLAGAEKMEIPYIIIMGQQEAKEESVVVRNMSNRSQETIPVAELISYLKKLK